MKLSDYIAILQVILAAEGDLTVVRVQNYIRGAIILAPVNSPSVHFMRKITNVKVHTPAPGLENSEHHTKVVIIGE